MELSGEIGPGEHRLIYSWLDLSTRCAERGDKDLIPAIFPFAS